MLTLDIEAITRSRSNQEARDTAVTVKWAASTSRIALPVTHTFIFCWFGSRVRLRWPLFACSGVLTQPFTSQPLLVPNLQLTREVACTNLRPSICPVAPESLKLPCELIVNLEMYFVGVHIV